ncbi:MAG: hypothetical protein OXC40_05015 [Proteobacteria bacterium]|nr:hypothetical protein [Pseudomonadota bacterium]
MKSYHIGVINLVLLLAGGCSVNPPSVEIENFQAGSNANNICSSPEGSQHPECEAIQFNYKILQNTRTDKNDRNSLTQKMLSDKKQQYLVLWAKLGGQYKWTIEFIPKNCGQNSRVFRFIPVKNPVIESGIIQPMEGSAYSRELSFAVNLKSREDVGEESFDGYIRDNGGYVNELEIKVQDVSYCLLEQRNNSGEQVDCHNPNLDDVYFRTDVLRVPYKLNFDGRQQDILCNAAAVAKSVGNVVNLGVTAVQTLAGHSCEKKRVSVCQ